MIGLLARILLRTADRRPPDFVIGRAGDEYLRRWWLIPRNPRFNIYLHQIIRSDDDRALHDHPWWNLSVILKGGYWEVIPCRRCGGATCDTLDARWRGAGMLAFRRATAAHRLYLPGESFAWTLFITGPRIREWGFHCPKGWVRWTDFVAPENTGDVGPGCGE